MLSFNFPGIHVPEPIVRILLLPAIHHRLAKHAVLVAQSIARGWELHGSYRIQEAGSETTEAAVPQTRIRFLLDEFKPIDTLVFRRLPRNWIEQEVGNIVGQRTADEKLQRQVVNALRILL